MKRQPLFAVALVALIALPASAATAGSLTLDSTCYFSGQPINANGAAWTPGAMIAITDPKDDFSATALADTTGAFMASFHAPTLSSSKPDVRSFIATATNSADPTQTATASFFAVQPGVGANVTGKLSTAVMWTIAGFVGGQTIYGHWVYHAHEQANVKMGKVPGECGTVKRSVRRIPVTAPGTGVWTAQFDASKAWHATTKPRVYLKIQVYTKFG